jgi:serine/threonine protein kinase/tetratricopeptide (TPR) repeat protein
MNDFFATPDPEYDSQAVTRPQYPAGPAGLGSHGVAARRIAVPGYDILALLGHGGMGVVYKARHRRLKRLVALKMIREGAHVGPNRLRRFYLEAEAVGRLNHPNIVQIYEVGEAEGLPFLSLELVEGGSLAERLDDTLLPCPEAARLVATLARAMHIAHETGIVHRDLKPGNILLQKIHHRDAKEADEPGPKSASRSGSSDPLCSLCLGGESFLPKITDFGLAKMLDDPRQTETGVILGTACYMAPEQAAGKIDQVGPATDVYGLGAILYKLLTGRPPFRGQTPLETQVQVLGQEPVPPRRWQPGVPRDLETICLKCLQKEQAKRYASAHDLAEDLRRFLHDEPIRARPAGLWERGVKWARRRPTAAALVGVAVLALAGFVALVLWHTGRLQQEVERAVAQRDAAYRAREVSDRRGDGLGLIRAGRERLAARDWSEAQARFTEARDRLGDAEDLADLRREAAELLSRAGRQLRFLQHRDEALFHASLFTGLNLAANVEKTRTHAREALALAGWDSDRQVLTLAPALADRRAEIAADCYELLLVLAEAVAQPLPGQDQAERARAAREALDILRQAAPLGQTQAFHSRRARYLAQLGDQDGAATAKQLAEREPPATALDYFLLGEERFRLQEDGRAAGHFEKVLSLQPGHLWARYFLALCHLDQKKYAEALDCLSVCLSKRPDFVWGYALRGFAYAELGAAAAAEADYQKALATEPEPAARYAVLVNRGMLLIRQEKFDQAAEDLGQAIALRPEEIAARVNLFEALRHSPLDSRQRREASAQLDKAIELKPEMAALYRLRAQLAVDRKDGTAALRDLEKAIQLETAGPRRNAKVLADDLLKQARLLHGLGKHQEAETACVAALAAHPEAVLAHRVRGEALLALERPAEAAAALGQYLEKEKGKPPAEVYRAYGLVQARLGKLTEGTSALTRAVELRPEDSELRAARGWVYLVCDAPKLALPDFDEAVRLLHGREASQPEARGASEALADALNGRGYARVLLGDQRQALADAEAALRLLPRKPRSLYNTARIFAQAAGRADKDPARAEHQNAAVTLIRQALERLPRQEADAFWRDYIRADPALLALQQVPGFVQLKGKYDPAAQAKR